jgi:diguanylate cyclase (GGDEF)-like protein
VAEPHAGPPPGAESAELGRAWALCYLDPPAALEAAEAVIARGDHEAAWGWWHAALAQVRAGSAEATQQALARSRALFVQHGVADAELGLRLADEVDAIVLRRAGDIPGCRARLDAVDRRLSAQPPAPSACGPRRDALAGFIGHNSRAITHKLLGEVDDGLRHFYAASGAAEASGNDGARLTALSNLGGYHQDLFNFDDALELSEAALAHALRLNARPLVAITSSNLILIHHALGQGRKAHARARFVLDHPETVLPGALDRLGAELALAHLCVGDLEAAQRFLDPGASAPVAAGDGTIVWAWVQAQAALARGDAETARRVTEPLLADTTRAHASAPYDLLQVLRAASEAAERCGALADALAHAREAQRVHEQLVGRSARARHRALQVRYELGSVQAERDRARHSQRSAEADRERLAELNARLQAKVAEVEQLHRELREQALRDPLTGLHNRRYLFESGPGLLELARRNDRPLVVALLDLDHFKLLNDTFGHAAGDSVLRRFAQLLQDVLRKSDVIVRHGGEEFVALMPEITAEGAAAVLSRLQEACRERPPVQGSRPLPTCSFSAGIAVFPRQGHTLDQLLMRADRALYSAKHHGRSRIEAAPTSGFSSLE